MSEPVKEFYCKHCSGHEFKIVLTTDVDSFGTPVNMRNKEEVLCSNCKVLAQVRFTSKQAAEQYKLKKERDLSVPDTVNDMLTPADENGPTGRPQPVAWSNTQKFTLRGF